MTNASGIYTQFHGDLFEFYHGDDLAARESAEFEAFAGMNAILAKRGIMSRVAESTEVFQVRAPLYFGDGPRTVNLRGPAWYKIDFNIHRSIHIPITEQTPPNSAENVSTVLIIPTSCHSQVYRVP